MAARENGNSASDAARADKLREIRDKLRQRDDSLLRDLEENLPALRSFLLGCGPWPEGRIAVSRNSREIVVRIGIPELDCQADYRGREFYGLLGTIDTDLAENTVAWTPGWQTVQRERTRIRKLLD